MVNGPVPMLMRLVWTSWIPIRNPTYQSPLSVVQTLACCPTSLGVDYQRDSMVLSQSRFNNVSMVVFLLVFTCHLISRSDELIVL